MGSHQKHINQKGNLDIRRMLGVNKITKIGTFCFISLGAILIVGLAIFAMEAIYEFRRGLDQIGYYNLTIAFILALLLATMIFFSIDKPVSVTMEVQEKEELAQYREAFKNLYHYIGSYPSWKAIQEYRELVLSLKPGTEYCDYHFHNVDAYLNKVVNELDNLRKYHADQYSKGYGWDSDTLPQAKGDYLLELIAARHPSFMNFNDQKSISFKNQKVVLNQ